MTPLTASRLLAIWERGLNRPQTRKTFDLLAAAYPGIDAEQRGQAEAIANNLVEMAALPVPVIIVVTGEGGSGGALALGIGDRVLMLEHAIYSVISPEGCASILWRDGEQAKEAAEALKLTSQDLQALDVIDRMIPEPLGGAHRNPQDAADVIRNAILKNLEELDALSVDQLLENRQRRLASFGQFKEA